MNITEVYLAWPVVDEYGRKGDLLGVFMLEQSALEAARGKGWYAGDGKVEGPFKVLNSFEEWQKQQIADEKERALNKLTSREKELLGLK